MGDIPAEQRTPLLVVAGVAVLALVITAVLARRESVVERVAVIVGALRPARLRRSVDDRRASGRAWHAEARRMVGDHRDQTVVLGLAVGAWVADPLCLFFTLVAAGVVVDGDVLLLAYTAGVLATEVSLLPAGLGLVEAAMPAVLRSFGVAYGTALAGTLIYRALGPFLPAIAGALALPSLRVIRHRKAPISDTPHDTGP